MQVSMCTANKVVKKATPRLDRCCVAHVSNRFVGSVDSALILEGLSLPLDKNHNPERNMVVALIN